MGRDVEDPRTGLTGKERAAIKATWAIFQANHSEQAAVVFVDMFTEYPEYKIIFKEFRHMDAVSMASSPKLIKHATAIVYTLTTFIETMDRPDVMTDLIKKNASDHINRKGVTPLHIRNFTKLLRERVEKVAAEKMDEDARTGWEKFVTLFINATAQTYVDAGVCTLDTAFTGVLDKGATDSTRSPGIGSPTRSPTPELGSPWSAPSGATSPRQGVSSQKRPKSSANKQRKS
ncbi:globin-like [Ornithodoros turicata]|uniref:globin-like n=1 Tax=Ornithodoros turicata TaxID=34597 RepID=UPI00313A44AE